MKQRALLATGMALAVAFLMALFLPGQSRLDFATLDIPSGASARKIGDLLKDAGIIRSPLLFRATARLRFLTGRLHAGEYRFSSRQSLYSVQSQLIHGEVFLHPVTLPEGLRMEEVFARIEEAGLAGAAALLAQARDPAFCAELGIPAKTLEGYLAPETYNFPKNFGEKNILKAMLARFRASLPADFQASASARGLTPHQAVILASLIEEEAYDQGERARISAVFQNRLRKNMKMESCASVSYALGRHKVRLYDHDLRVESPYNTYLHHGLPPGPICSPRRESLEAAVHPETTPYLFFVSRQDGTHEFTQTYEDHLKAKARLEKKLGNNKGRKS